jgi:hypothetical protein
VENDDKLSDRQLLEQAFIQSGVFAPLRKPEQQK